MFPPKQPLRSISAVRAPARAAARAAARPPGPLPTTRTSVSRTTSTDLAGSSIFFIQGPSVSCRISCRRIGRRHRPPGRHTRVYTMSLRKFYDLVILDWAGTMVDFGCCAPVCALMEAFKRYGVTVTEEEVRRDMGRAKADHVRALLSEQRIAGAWRTANGRNPTAHDIERLISDLTPLMRDQAARAASLIEGARAAVDALRAAGLKI